MEETNHQRENQRNLERFQRKEKLKQQVMEIAKENGAIYPTFHILENKPFKCEFFIKNPTYPAPEHQNHFRLGYLTPVLLGNKQTFYMHGLILKVILLNHHDYFDALESTFSLKRLTSLTRYTGRVNHVDSLDNNQLDCLTDLKNNLNQENGLVHNLLKKGLVFNKFYNQPKSESYNFSDYKIEFSFLSFSTQELYRKMDLTLDQDRTYLPIETITNFNDLENVGGRVKLQKVENGENISEEVFYIYISIESFLEPLKFIKSIKDFEENFLDEAIEKVKQYSVVSLYPSLFHSEYLKEDNTI
jgi:hypothetical protein